MEYRVGWCVVLVYTVIHTIIHLFLQIHVTAGDLRYQYDFLYGISLGALFP